MSATRRAAVLLTTLVTAGAGLAAVGAPASAAVRRCGNSDLAVSNAAPQGAAGHGAFALEFKNTSSTSCTLYGYPGLDALDAHGHTLAHAARTALGSMGGAHHIVTVTLAHNGFASATVEWANISSSGTCTYSAKVATTPPSTTKTVTLPVSVSLCSLQVHPVVAGTSGQN